MKTRLRAAALTTSFLALAVVAGLDASPAQAQSPALPGTTYTLPSNGILKRFSTRGGIGTTPFLGNVRGLGAFSTNYDRVSPEVKSSYRSYNRRFFRRTR